MFPRGSRFPKDPARQITSLKTAWNNVRKKAGVYIIALGSAQRGANREGWSQTEFCLDWTSFPSEVVGFEFMPEPPRV